MKTTLLKIFFLILILYFSVSVAKETYTTQEELKKIDEETQKCIDKNYETDYDMMQCSLKGIEKYNKEINRTVAAAKDMLSKTQYEQFLKTQKAWENFMKEEDNLLKQTYEKDCPPYLPCLTGVDIKHDYIKERAEDLSGFLGVWKLFKEDGVLDDGLNFVPFNN